MLRPPDATGTLPVILYMHGGGWVLGNAGTHDRLVRELVNGTGAALAFVEYDRSPEARFPVAIEQGYAVAQHIMRDGEAHGLDPSRMAVAGDSVGGCMTAALTLMAEGRGDVRFVHQSMYYPVTDAAMDTASYEQFAEGYYLSAKAMAWFWDAYAPDPETRRESYASPLQALRPAARRAPAGARDRRRVRRAARRGRGLRGAPAGERGRRHHRPLRRRDPRLHDAQPAQRDPRDARRDRPGHRDAARGTAMNAIHVIVTGPEEAYDDVAELWCANELLGVTVLHAGRLHLRIDPRTDGAPWLADVVGLARALTEAQERLAAY